MAVTVVTEWLPGEATAAGAGIIQPWSSSVAGQYYDAYAAGAEYYPRLIERMASTGIHEIGYRRTGGLIVNDDPAVLDAVEHRLAERAPSAPMMGEVRRLDGAAARELFPPLAPGLGALHVGGGARVDGRALRAALLDAARRLGATVVESHATLMDAARWAVLLADETRLDADAVVVAAGAWTNQVLAATGMSVDVEPQRGQITHLRLAGVDTSGWPSVHPVSHHYLVAFDDRVVVGATRETGSGFDVRVTAAGQRQVLDDALRIAPGLADATVIETRVGLRPMPASDGLPRIGALDVDRGLWVNAGFGAGGLTMGPYAGEQLAAEIAEALG
jgi:D-amino-acid dehydrogenase